MNWNSLLLKITVTVLLSVMLHQAHSQVIVEADTIVEGRKVIEPGEEIHSPRKATIYSAILPGLGQAYNKKYWKIPIIYAGFGAIGYFINWNNDHYQFNKTAYQHLTDDNDETNAFMEIEAVRFYDLDNPTSRKNFRDGLLRQQDYYRRNRDLLIISFLGFYGLNIIDASVDAHLYDFDISDDLTFHWQPSIQHFRKQNVYSINCTFNF
ncbi:MAG: DUF5683 domain-containing protein [Prolixibacteraceae bacterium]